MESSPDRDDAPPAVSLLDEVRVVNVGLSLLGDAIRQQGGAAVDVDWRIPAGGREDLARVAGADLDPEAGESQALVLGVHGDGEVREDDFSFLRRVRHGQREARGERGDEHLGRHGTRVGPAVLGRLVDHDLEVADRHPAPVSALPVGGNLHAHEV